MGTTAQKHDLVAILLVASSVIIWLIIGFTMPVVAHSSVGSQQQETHYTPVNSTQQINPSGVNQPGDLADVQGWLSGRMGETLIDCSEGINIGAYEPCTRLDGDYPGWLEKFVTLASDTPSSTDEKAVDAFKNAVKDQRNFKDQVKEFRETHKDYQQARRDGNEGRARSLARQLDSIATKTTITGDSLIDRYRRIESKVTVDLTLAKTSINETVTNLSDTATEIESITFIDTSLTAASTNTTISFLNPLQVEGQLRTTENETSLANQTIRLTIGDHTETTTTDETGSFTFTHRPIDLPANTSTATVTFVPDPAGPYASEQVTLPITVNQTTPTITIDRTPEHVGFADTISISGTVSAAELPVSSVPLMILIDGRPVKTVRTNQNGAYKTSYDVPADLQPGTHSLLVQVALSDRALAENTTETRITVTDTATNLTLIATATNGRDITLAGQLTTTDGTPVSDQQLTITLNNTSVKTATTNASGHFTRSVTISKSLFTDNRNATIVTTVRYTGQGTNLEPSMANQTITIRLSSSVSTNTSNLLLNQQPLIIVLSLLALLALAASWWPYRHETRFSRAIVQSVPGLANQPLPEYTESSSTASAQSSASEASKERPTETADTVIPPIKQARQLLESDPADAVSLVYHTTRGGFTDSFDIPRSATHRQFQTLAAQELDAEEATELNILVNHYEKAIFSPQPISMDAAREAVESAEEFL